MNSDLNISDYTKPNIIYIHMRYLFEVEVDHVTVVNQDIFANVQVACILGVLVHCLVKTFVQKCSVTGVHLKVSKVSCIR